ncbi:SMP-30/gluconolactonase/LRE family protein [Paracidovorax cattleyae]|uniref:SMP-30/gluconolactonase/LRE family protein n=1 Tax=Paracidovorax cattleyae TaxID=80868 RepID=UPI0018AF5F61|nr:SMP-30/gluconolactonase/LRE family protein [Paracidovorax cattleyae]
MNPAIQNLLPGRLLRRPGRPMADPDFPGVRIGAPRLADVLAPDAPLWVLHEGAIHAEGPAWQASHRRLLFSDVPSRRVNAWYEEDGRVESVIDPAWFPNGNAVAADGRVYHCEHGRRCISRSAPDLRGEPEPIVTHYEGRRLNAPNDVAIAPDKSVWFTDPVFGIVMPAQGALAEPELAHRSLYRFDPASGTLARMADFEQPNGVALAPDGRTVYVTDTSRALGEAPGGSPGSRHEVEAFTVGADGALAGRRFFCSPAQGNPDGLSVDGRGWVWCSAADGVHIWSAEQEYLGAVPIAETVCNVCFGGSSGRRLFIAASTRLLAIDLRES